MLLEYLQRAREIGADAIELEYKDRKLWVFAYHFNVGAGIGSVPSNSKQSKALFKELDELKKKKVVELGGVAYRLKFSEYDSFGELTQRIEMKEARRTT